MLCLGALLCPGLTLLHTHRALLSSHKPPQAPEAQGTASHFLSDLTPVLHTQERILTWPLPLQSLPSFPAGGTPPALGSLIPHTSYSPALATLVGGPWLPVFSPCPRGPGSCVWTQHGAWPRESTEGHGKGQSESAADTIDKGPGRWEEVTTWGEVTLPVDAMAVALSLVRRTCADVRLV